MPKGTNTEDKTTRTAKRIGVIQALEKRLMQ